MNLFFFILTLLLVLVVKIQALYIEFDDCMHQDMQLCPIYDEGGLCFRDCLDMCPN